MDQSPTVLQTRCLYLFIGVAVIVNFSGLFIPIIGPDGTLYALIAKNMVQRNDYINLYDHGADWLDKPHFPFWVTALSFKLFGFTTSAYKLPGILFMLIGAGYTYLFAKILYGKHIALWSVLILLSSQHIVLSNNDVRAEPYLTGLVIAAVCHFYKAEKLNSYRQLLAACIFTACAIMTKGMFALIPIGGAMLGQFVITKQWKALFNIKWLIAVVLILIFILPELLCLYRQFDLHPEKIVFGQKGVSGIRFFFWDSQFGRFFNTGPIKGHGDPSFFIHTTLWAFLPWSLLLFASIYQFIKQGIKTPKETEWYCISGALLTFLLFSASRFQLPHYLNIVFPFFAIITAQYIYQVRSVKTIRAVGITQTAIIVILLTGILLLNYFFQPENFSLLSKTILIALYFILAFFPKELSNFINQTIVYRTVLVSFIVNLYLNLAFYPSLLHYQAGSEAAMWINKHNPGQLPVMEFENGYVSAFEFYSDSPVMVIDADGKGNVSSKPFILYAPADIINTLSGKGSHIQPLTSFHRYWISRLKLSFLNRATRAGELTVTEVVVVN